MICLTIELNDQEWFIDRDMDVLRMVTDPHIQKKFAELTPDELIEVNDALDYRLVEVTDLQTTLATFGTTDPATGVVSYDYDDEEKAQPTKVVADNKPPKTTLWGK